MARRIDRAILGLESNPRPVGCMKLTATDDRWRLRVGHYRILYAINDSAKRVVVFRILHRKDAFRA